MAVKNCLPEQLQISRLKSRADFINARSGARSHERAFVLQLIKRASGTSDDLRVGFTVTKKVGNAVVRNRIKRRLREAVRFSPLPLSCAGHDMVLIARIEALNEPFDDLVSSVARGLEKAFIGKNKTKRNVANSAKGGQNPTGD